MIVKNRRRVDFYTHVVATTPEDSSSRRRIWRYGERSFSSMRTASLRGFFTSGRRSRGRRSDLLKLPSDNGDNGDYGDNGDNSDYGDNVTTVEAVTTLTTLTTITT